MSFFVFFTIFAAWHYAGLGNHGFAKEILGKSLKIHEFPRKA